MDHGTPRHVRERCVGALAQVAQTTLVALAVATLVGLALDGLRPGAAVHTLWMGTSGAPPLDAWLAGGFAALVLFQRPLAARWPRATCAAAVLTGCLVSSLTVAALGRHGLALAQSTLLFAGWAPPVTLLALLLVVPWTLGPAWGRAGPVAPRAGALVRLGGTALAGLCLTAGQIGAVGATDYRTHADAILVLGAKVHPDGRPSGALEDRVRTACDLWRRGLAPVLVLSGGRGADAPLSEPLAMAALALRLGVPGEALVLDEEGRDTEASVRFTARFAAARGWRRVVVVSHDYHLARVRLLAAREGLPVRTVPAEETHPRAWKGAAFGREVAAYVATWIGLPAARPLPEHACGG
jgi:uncharacterized SAM-binding protein YcdF (DUF218 family)